ncbi:MAG: cytidine deaminase [Tannerellaceae bacterium]|nr:cytidine deaminase [Tannerellaceae bacterium]
MRELIIETKIKVFPVDGMPDEYRKLAKAAQEATRNAYAPYSNFNVGSAVLLDNGEIISGNNQENAAYPSGLCAERVALFAANSQYPDSKVLAIAIAAVAKGEQVNLITPCGACRQVLFEVENRYNCPMKVILCGKERIYITESASSLLPLSFDGSDLPK